MQKRNPSASTAAQKSTTDEANNVNPQLQQCNVGGALLKSLHEDLKGFHNMGFLTPDAKSGLGIAIEQVERYMRGDLVARQQ